jgi:alpha-L-arabinofuranosidase
MIMLFLAACQSAEPTSPPTAEPGNLYVNPDVDLGPISPFILGSNFGPWTSVSLDMLPYALDTGVTVLRFPGGNWGDRNKVQTYHLDQFMGFSEQMNANVTVSVNLRDGTVEDAVQLLHYANIEKGYEIKYWSIGNEPTLYEVELGETYDTEIFNKEWREYAEAMKAVDPDILLMGPELHQWGTNLENTLKDSSGRDWMTEFLKANGDLVDIVTVHRYPFYSASGEKTTIPELRENTHEWPEMVTYLNNLIREITGRELPIAFTEVNSDPSPVINGESSPDSFFNAIWFADVLGKMVQEKAFMINHWVLSQRGSGHGLISGYDIRPTYYTFLMYKHFGLQQVHTSSGIPDVNVYAALRDDGNLTIMVVNLSDAEQHFTMQIEGKIPANAQVLLLDSTHNAEDLGQQNWPEDGILTLPAQSVTLYIIE